MPKPRKGTRLGGSPSHQKAITANLAKALIEYERIATTEAKAKMARSVVDKLVTYGKKGDLHSRRMALRILNDRDSVHKLFAEIAPRYIDREGGYTRILKLGSRQGDNAAMVFLEFV